MDDPQVELDELLAEMASRGIRIKKKSESWFRLGKNYTTTIGKTIYIPDNYDEWNSLDKLCTLKHEMVHVNQYAKYSVPLFLFLYLFCFFPVGLAYFRYRVERTAYLVGIIERTKYLGDEYYAPYAAQAVSFLTGSDYGWAWPFRKSVQAWFDGMDPRK